MHMFMDFSEYDNTKVYESGGYMLCCARHFDMRTLNMTSSWFWQLRVENEQKSEI